MNLFARLTYNLHLSARTRTRILAEKIYYKVFPERIGEHELAMRPIVPLRITTYDLHCINLVAEEILPREMTYYINEAQEEEFDKYLKRKLFSKFEPELIKYMKISRSLPTDPYGVTFRARIKFYVDEREEA